MFLLPSAWAHLLPPPKLPPASSPMMAGTRVLVLDAASTAPGTAGLELEEGRYSNRVTALTPSSTRFLKSIGVWEAVEREHPFRVRRGGALLLPTHPSRPALVLPVLGGIAGRGSLSRMLMRMCQF